MTIVAWFLFAATWGWFLVTALVLSRVDFKEHRLPNFLVFTAYLGGLLGFGLISYVQGDSGVLLQACAGSVLAVFAYLIIHILGGMGMGDVKYAAVIGLYLGSLGWTYLYIGSLITFGAAALWALPLMIGKGKTRSLPFGPFMAFGVLASGFIALGVSATV